MKLRIVILAMVLVLATSPVSAQSFNQFIAFGDSAIDSGFFLTHQISANKNVQAAFNASAAIGGGLPTTPGGPVNSQVLASFFGLTAIPVGQPGGTNFSASGATNASKANGFSTANPFAPAIPTQIQSYLNSTGSIANPNALYFISGGANDISKVICPGGVCGPTAVQQAILTAQLQVAAISQLYTAGARYIVVPVNQGSRTPKDPEAFAPGSPESLVFQAHDRTMYGGLIAAGVKFIPADGRAVATAIGFNPASFGFTNILAGSLVTHQGGACINPLPNLILNSWALECTTLVAPNAQRTFLFADDEHYTAAGQKIMADYVYSLITAPSEISYLAEAPVKTRASIISAINNQIPISLSQPGRYHAWVSGDVSWLKLSNSNLGFPDDPGTPVSATAGFDFRVTPNWLVGVAFSEGTTKQTFNLGGGFSLDEFAVSAYAAYLDGPFWGHAVASGGGLFFDANRQVPIGITTQSNTSKTKGSNYSLAFETGYNFTGQIGAATFLIPGKETPTVLNITHGPIVGIALQQIHVNGFTETDQFAADAAGGFTALSFLGQIRNSAVTELGYQVNVDFGMWQPFAKLVWNHELANTNRLVTAALTTTAASFAPSFSLPGVVFGKDWGTATLGTSVKISHNVTGYVTFNSQFAERNVTNYGGQVGINVALGPELAINIPANTH